MLKYIFTTLQLLVVLQLKAQVPQYSQFYANALYLSPSFAGGDYSTRGILASRYQWPGLSASYISNAISVDHYIADYKSGVGLIVNHDIINPSRIKTTDIGIMYSYEATIKKNLTFRPGLQMSFVNRRMDLSNLTFGSQYSDDGFVGGATNESSKSGSIYYLDFAAGGLFMTNKFWIGASYHHLNRPNQSFLGRESLLPVKASYFGGYKILLMSHWKSRYINPGDEISLSPTFMYKLQGKSDQLDLGLYFRYNIMAFGLWYRSIPVKIYKPDKINQDALVFMIGMIYKNFTAGYSFDLTTSKLTMESLGSHEITMSYRIKSKKKKAIQKRPVCPDF